MGTILSRFRKKKTTIEVLEDLDKKIKDIEKYGLFTEQRHKKIVGTLIAYSVILYIIAALTCYFYFFPTSPYDQLIYVTPLLIFPILILFVKRLVSWYYKRKLRRNEEKLSTMQQEKKKILDEVTETETYKKAKEILLKFAPDQLRMTPLSPQPTFAVTTPNRETPRRPSTPQPSVLPLPGAGELRRRALTSSNIAQSVGTPLPRPILPQHRSYLDKLVEYLVGDGPSNRYALICRQCESHNGMALKEEFEYFGFRCCYCNFWNPARKQKPSAPKLEHDSSILSPSATTAPLTISNVVNSSLQPVKLSDTEGSSTPSETDSDIEVVEKPVETAENEVLGEKGKGDVDDSKNVGESKRDEEAKGQHEVEKDSLSERMDVDQSPVK
ncbi:endoplasmic reticulum junction formation protein lunapark-B isoform X3 [Belonocnema kinseyi]|uniref:endoplasmic reticulum junction formation protein lunapark-B isoform X3 n=1 Tax=Belonocnema kinseyi TaxID=2817044 RepID=UPI00143DD268|nr:endoplasmic reticulum junction formation protein lunapark-B isoform X3 [Belonocnema kinseyi]